MENILWFEFLLNKDLLLTHLQKSNPDPPPLTLLQQFIANIEKCPEDMDEMHKLHRTKKNNSLRLMALQTAAFLEWDLDVFVTLPLHIQTTLMELIKATENDFLDVLYHRWVLRNLQSNIKSPLTAEDTIKTLKAHLSSKTGTTIPSFTSLSNSTKGLKLKKADLNSMIHIDLAIYLLYKGKTGDAIFHFKKQNISFDFPYLKIGKSKLDGYLKSLGIIKSRKVEDQFRLDLDDIFKFANNEANDSSVGILASDFKGKNDHYEKMLVETSDPVEVKNTLMQLHSMNAANARSYSKLFSGWIIPIPLQNTIVKIQNGVFQDYIYILVAKAKQLMGIKHYGESKEMLKMTINELNITYYQKLIRMLEWEILLVDLNDLFTNNNASPDIVIRCKECLKSLQSSEVNPRSEIVESILMALTNLGEFKFVFSFDVSFQRWPFIEFLCLQARVCQDLIDRKDNSSNFREMWSAVLPVFSTQAKKKPSQLSTRTALNWILERSKCQPLITIWVSLLAKLHNHILDDVGLSVHAEYLHVWPNILDDITQPTQEKEKQRATTKMNIRTIKDSLFLVLKQTEGEANEVNWLKCLGDLHLASGNSSLAMKSYIEYLSICTDFFEKHNSNFWSDNGLLRGMIRACENLGAFTQAMILTQFLTEVDYSLAFGMAQEKTTTDGSDSLYGFIWDLTILEFLINLHTKRNEIAKRMQAVKVVGLLELNSNNSEEIQRESICLRKSQFMRTLAKLYIFL